MTRVLEVAYCFGYGGIRACIQNYIYYLDKDEFQIDLFIYGTDDSPFRSQMEEMGCRMFFDPINYIVENRIKEFVNVLTDFIRKGKYDVVHAHCNLISAWVTLAAWRAGAKVRIAHSHSTVHLSNNFIQNCWCYLRRWIINCTATTRMACGQLAGEGMYGKDSTFVVLQNGIDVEKFATRNEQKISELRREFNIQEGQKVYMNITRFDSQKNLTFLVTVINELHRLEPQSVFIIGGTKSNLEDNSPEIKAYLEAHGLNECVRLVGSRMDIQHLYQLSDCWIFPSKYEGLPFIPIELQAASVPCLASDTITKDIDLGLGLVEFMSLDESPIEWAKKAMSMNKCEIPLYKVLAAFQKCDFDIQTNARKLERMYKGEI